MKTLISFESVHFALECEDKLKSKYKLRTIPTPREITLSCGISLLIDTTDIEKLKRDLDNIKYKGIYKYKKEGIKTILEKVDI